MLAKVNIHKKDILRLLDKAKSITTYTVENSGVDASIEPPNQTAYLCIGWLPTFTSKSWAWRRTSAKNQDW